MIIGNGISYDSIKDLKLYRLRIPSRNDSKLIDQISYYNYPPIEYTKLGRANLANQQVFYASADANTTMFEMRKYIKPLNKIVLLSVWGIKPYEGNIFSRSMFYGIPENSKNNLASILSTGLDKKLNSYLKGMPNKARLNFLYAQKKLSGIFSWKGKRFYPITAALANDTFVEAKKQNIDIPILIYPSVAKNLASVNFAIRKDFADNQLELKYVLKFKINTLQHNKVNIDVIAKGMPIGDKVHWKVPKIRQTFSRPLISLNGSVKDSVEIKADLKFTPCCINHAFDIEEMSNKLLLQDRLNNILSKVLMDFYAEFPQRFQALVSIKMLKPLYLTDCVNIKDKIPFLIYPVQVEYRIED